MFVDIGSKRDGLVHVKDISKDYFINNHQSVSDVEMLLGLSSSSVICLGFDYHRTRMLVTPAVRK